MFNIFKSKEQKQKFKEVELQKKEVELQKELGDFIQKNKPYFDSYCFNGKDIIIYRTPAIVDGEVVLYFKDKDTPKGIIKSQNVRWLEMGYGENFMELHRMNFIRLKDQMEKLGISLTLKKTEEV